MDWTKEQEFEGYDEAYHHFYLIWRLEGVGKYKAEREREEQVEKQGRIGKDQKKTKEEGERSTNSKKTQHNNRHSVKCSRKI